MADDGFSAKTFGPDPAATSKTNNYSGSNGSNPPNQHGVLWPQLTAVAYQGLAGEVVAALSPHTESDPIALLLQFITCFGNAIGRAPYYLVESSRHFPNIFVLLVGDTSKSRKGTAADRVRLIFDTADSNWNADCVTGGMSSGEGVIWAIRDPIFMMKRGILELSDPGIADKRLMLDEREFFQALTVMKRQGNTLSRIIRDAWDCRPVIRTLTKNSPAKVTDPYISIIGHITAFELQESLDHTSMANAYANRFLFGCVRRSKALPHGGQPPNEAVTELGNKTAKALEAARMHASVEMEGAAMQLWENVYASLSAATPGLLGAIASRAEAQTIRLALLYALLDGSSMIGREHLEAALALWAYCNDSARYIFGDLLGNTVADEILRALRAAGTNGMTRREMRDLFQRNRTADEIGKALGLLLAAGKARFTRTAARRGPWMTETWFAS
jgi:hypothetical protein